VVWQRTDAVRAIICASTQIWRGWDLPRQSHRRRTTRADRGIERRTAHRIWLACMDWRRVRLALNRRASHNTNRFHPRQR